MALPIIGDGCSVFGSDTCMVLLLFPAEGTNMEQSPKPGVIGYVSG
jgi:hypothetical protein